MNRKILIDGKIDLHGMTETQAFEELKRFFSNALNKQKKYLLVITGKGRPDKPSIIRTNFTRWLEYTELKKFVAGYSIAPDSLGGSGAFIVKLKK